MADRGPVSQGGAAEFMNAEERWTWHAWKSENEKASRFREAHVTVDDDLQTYRHRASRGESRHGHGAGGHGDHGMQSSTSWERPVGGRVQTHHRTIVGPALPGLRGIAVYAFHRDPSITISRPIWELPLRLAKRIYSVELLQLLDVHPQIPLRHFLQQIEDLCIGHIDPLAVRRDEPTPIMINQSRPHGAR